MADYIESFTSDFNLDPARCALVVVDMQYASGSRSHGLGRWLNERGRLDEANYRFQRIEQVVVPGIARLLASFRARGLRVVFVTLGPTLPDFSDAPEHMRQFFAALNNHVGTREHEILDSLKPLSGELVLRKVTQGAFASSGIERALQSLGVSQLVMTGVSTNNCVETTAREASDRGHQVVLVSDATGTCSESMQRLTETSFSRLWGRVMTVDEVLRVVESDLS